MEPISPLAKGIQAFGRFPDTNPGMKQDSLESGSMFT
jgi:hypothetical protein